MTFGSIGDLQPTLVSIFQMLYIVHYQRKRRANANYSLEAIFEDLRARSPNELKIDLRLAPFHSNGIFRRLAIVWDVWIHQRAITHVTGDINFAVLGAARKNALITVLDCGFLNRRTGMSRWILKKLWLDWPIAWSTKVTTISHAMKDEICQFTGCSAEKIQVIPVAISERFARSPADFCTTYPRILHVGTAPNKNLNRLCDAIAGIPCKLVVVGQISAETKQLLISKQIDYENHVGLSLDELIKQYELCDILAFVSTYEGFGMPILEAQAVGRPVITGNVSSMPEVAGDGACLVDPFDSHAIRSGLQRIIQDEAYRTSLIESGFENVKRFNAEAIAEQYWELYREFLSNRT